MKKLLILSVFIVTFSILLTGCGDIGTASKLKSMASKYVKEKYGFKAKTGRVSIDGVNWLTPIWEGSKSGLVEMTYDGKDFVVFADINSGVEECTDNYMEDEFCEEIESYFKDIPCDDKDIMVSYTEGQYKHMVGREVKALEDLIADKDTMGISVHIYTYGLDTNYIASMDMSEMNWISTVRFHDWIDGAYVHSEYKPVNPPNVDMFIHKYYAEYNSDPGKYFSDIGEYEKDRFTLIGYNQIQEGDLKVAYEASGDIDVSVYEESPESEQDRLSENLP